MKKIAVFVDYSNINSAFNALCRSRSLPPNLKLDYGKLLEKLSRRANVVSRRVYYCDNNTLPQITRDHIRRYWENLGYTVISKLIKIVQTLHGNKNKANFDVEIAFDIGCRDFTDDCTDIIIMSGDSDFAYLIPKLQARGLNVTFISTEASIAKEILSSDANIVLLDDLDLDQITYALAAPKTAA